MFESWFVTATAHNIWWILFIFGTANAAMELSEGMNLIDYEVSMLIS